MTEKKVDFFIVGAAKSGTTSMFRYLAEHRQIFMPEDKEPHFFGDQRPFAKYGQYQRYEDYFRLFAGAGADQLLGEGSTAYIYSATAPAEIKRYNPNAKIIIFLRDPRDRAYSLYWHHIRDFGEPKGTSFEQALALEPERIAHKWAFGFHYLESGLYFQQVKRYLDIFGEEQIRVVLMDELRADTADVIEGLCKFLGIENRTIDSDKIHNRSGVHKNRFIAYWLARPNAMRRVARAILPKRLRRIREEIVQRNLVNGEPMRAETRALLTDYFRDDVAKLQQLIGKDLTAWTR